MPTAKKAVSESKKLKTTRGSAKTKAKATPPAPRHQSVVYEERAIDLDVTFDARWETDGGDYVAITVSGTCPGCDGEMKTTLPSFFPGAMSSGAKKFMSKENFKRKSEPPKQPDRATVHCFCNLRHADPMKALHRECGAVFEASLRWPKS